MLKLKLRIKKPRKLTNNEFIFDTLSNHLSFPCERWITSSSNTEAAITLTPRAKKVDNNALKQLNLDLNDEE